ncbi:MAG TPA: prenyltransferase [Spirochaetia bacterium]|nr:prenyltransferase [Spirochaetia bacterium]
MKLDFAMWRDAILFTPHVDEKRWNKLDHAARWLISGRFSEAVATVTAALIAGTLSFRFETINIGMWVLFALCALFIHLAANFVIDAVDFARGVDRNDFFRGESIPHPLQTSLASTPLRILYPTAHSAVAVACAVILIQSRGGLSLPLLLLSLLLVVLLLIPLHFPGKGEIAVLILFGPMVVGGGFYTLTGTWNWMVVLAGLPFAVGVSASLLGRNIDSLEVDRARGVATLPQKTGERRARFIIIGLVGIQLLIVGFLVYERFYSPILAVVLLSLARFFRRVLPKLRRRKPTQKPAWYELDRWPHWFGASLFDYNRIFGLLYLLGIVADTAVRLAGVIE